MSKHDRNPTIYPTMIVSNVVRTGRFRVRPGKWWEFTTFVVEVEELISYERLQDFMPDPDEPPAKVWRKANMSEMLNAPKEFFAPRQMDLREDVDAGIARYQEMMRKEVVVELKCDTKAVQDYLARIGDATSSLAQGAAITRVPVEPDRHLALKIYPQDLYGAGFFAPLQTILDIFVKAVKQTWPEDEIYQIETPQSKAIEIWRRGRRGVL